MVFLVTGGSASGKSEYAENLSLKIKNKDKGFYYIATMKPFDKECEKRIDRHRLMRKDKGFMTIECYEDLSTVNLESGSTVLLECMSNLLANVLYGEEKIDNVVGYIVDGLFTLSKNVENIVIVTNEIFSCGLDYDESTMEYIKYLGQINQAISKFADSVVEVVYTIPIIHKGKDLLK